MPISEEVRRVSETILKADGIHTFIGQHHILQGVSFEAKADGVTVLLGRNGAGASDRWSYPSLKAGAARAPLPWQWRFPDRGVVLWIPT